MLPISDNVPARSRPIVNYMLMAACLLAFLYELSLGHQAGTFVKVHGMIPARLTGQAELITTAGRVLSPWPTLLSCMFLHAGWLHLLGNMWFLYIFGDNVEDRLGHLGFLVFYLAGGVAASGVHVVMHPGSPVPVVGASGAVAAVMGAYLLLYPRAMIVTLVPIFLLPYFLLLPAVVFLALWFVVQLFGGFSAGSQMATGVAWWAHVGGFVAGMTAVYVLRRAGLLRPPMAQVVRTTAPFRPYAYRYRRR